MRENSILSVTGQKSTDYLSGFAGDEEREELVTQLRDPFKDETSLWQAIPDADDFPDSRFRWNRYLACYRCSIIGSMYAYGDVGLLCRALRVDVCLAKPSDSMQ